LKDEGENVATKVHCPYRQALLIQNALAPDKMRVAFLLGAGCPVSIRVPSATGTEPLMPDIAELTKRVNTQLNADPAYKSTFTLVCARAASAKTVPPTVEEILSCVRTLHEVAGSAGIDGLSKASLSELDKKICDLVTEVVQERLPNGTTPYHQLASWMGSVRRSNPVEVFTPNYDLLMEQAFEERKVPYFDGFVGGDNTFFDLASMEQEILPSRWARLWKLHGSINWWRTSSGEVQRRGRGKNPDDRQMIYPSHLKYDESRRMPYLAMLDRLRAFLNHGQAVLVTCGYSYGDQHLNEVILQGLNGNPTAVCFGLLYGERGGSPEAVKRATMQANLSILAVDGAVLGTVEGDWDVLEKATHPLHDLAVVQGALTGRTSAPNNRSKFLLGDFATFGKFLAHQLSHLDLFEETGNV
jgi:hypothetical protein